VPGGGERSGIWSLDFAIQNRRGLWGFRVDTFNECRGAGVGPIGMKLLQIGADSFARVIRRHALPLEREGSCAYFRDQLVFLSHQRTIAGSAVVGQDVRGVEAGDFVDYGQP